jgi:hypothetical protein
VTPIVVIYIKPVTVLDAVVDADIDAVDPALPFEVYGVATNEYDVLEVKPDAVKVFAG